MTRALVTAPLRGDGFDKLRRLADVVYDPWIDQRPLRIYTAEQLAERISAVGADVVVVEGDSVSGPVFELGLRAIASTRGIPTTSTCPARPPPVSRCCSLLPATRTGSPR
ncbi:putative d-3-phosphoglycerate dehydrogenase serA2 [Mycobacterium xenopi 4042]|uniref:Putative d-3-phosphoglycerate dehydrogenase serA2 n=1 Tax=Mycobacterium xenopi 4042 TaxID=1299334 RepID=X7YKB1_MYCXE|nr:putative d-3-phosphoglycerate dehydrogenase serA2 [Mycobacterium xenopi 4042]